MQRPASLAWIPTLTLLIDDTDHPADAEAVGEHAEAPRPERLGQWHLYLPTFPESGKKPIGLRFISDCD
jgi:hypothetical protein